MNFFKIPMSALIILISISNAFAGRGRIEEMDPLHKLLNIEIGKDLEGKPSCFKGKIKEKMLYMQVSYGGRFGGSYNMELLRIAETQYRYLSKYCERILDRNFEEVKESTDESEYAYRQCTHTNLSTSIAGITFGASTTGTFEQEGMIFNIRHDVTNDLIVDYSAGYHPEDSEIKSWQVSEELECTIL